MSSIFSIFFVLFLWWFLTGIILYTAKRLDLGDSKSRLTVVIVTLPLFFCAWYFYYHCLNDIYMKVSHNWLKNLVEITSTPEDLSEKLSIGGFEVESLHDCSENVNGVVLGKVLSVLKHKGSDKLSICHVDIGMAVPSS